MREKIKLIIETPAVQNTIIVLIVINAIILGAETSKPLMESYGHWLKIADTLILNLFIIEIVVRIFIYGGRFFLRPWNLFDSAVVAVALIPASEAFAALRALRVLRVLRLISIAPAMRRVIEGLISAIPGILSVATIMVLFFYIFAVIGTHLYSETFPQWFGTLGETMYTLFQIMTLESWSMGIVRPVMNEHPGAWAFFVSYILVTTFTMLNLFIAIIVNAMHHDEQQETEQNHSAEIEGLACEIKAMEKRLLKEIRAVNNKPID